MLTYYFYFSLFVILANFGYGFAQLGKGKAEIFSLPLFLTTIAISVVCLGWIQKRLRAVQKKNMVHQSEPTVPGGRGSP